MSLREASAWLLSEHGVKASHVAVKGLKDAQAKKGGPPIVVPEGKGKRGKPDPIAYLEKSVAALEVMKAASLATGDTDAYRENLKAQRAALADIAKLRKTLTPPAKAGSSVPDHVAQQKARAVKERIILMRERAEAGERIH